MGRTDKTIHFTSNTLTLEGMLSLPRKATMVPGAVICHPHPQYGGDMDNNVVQAVADALGNLDMAVLRFNFRGVNGSEGRFDNGNGEINDVLAAFSFLTAQEIVDSNRLFLVGYSFGAFVGLQAALQISNITALAAISPPVSVYDFGFLSAVTMPILIVSGDRDSFCSLSKLEESYRAIAGVKEKRIVPASDHFYWGKEAPAAEAVQHFFRNHISDPR